MIVIDRVRIQGFRGIERLQMSLSRTSVLIGPNNSGKSSVLKALELALSDEISVNASDFHEPVKGRPGNRIVIDIRFIPVSDSDHRDARFSDDWQKQFVGLIRHDRYHREYMAFRTVFTLETDGVIKKSRYVINHWDAAKSGAELKELPESLQFVSIDADENILEDLVKNTGETKTTLVIDGLRFLHNAMREEDQVTRPSAREFDGFLRQLAEREKDPEVLLARERLTGRKPVWED